MVEMEDTYASYIPYHQMVSSKRVATQPVTVPTPEEGNSYAHDHVYGYGYGYESVYEPCITSDLQSHRDRVQVQVQVDADSLAPERDIELQPEGRLWRYLDNIASSSKSLSDIFTDSGPYQYR